MFSSDAYVSSSTVGSRINEIKAAWEHIVVHPWQGIGIGAIYNYELRWNLDTNSFEWRGITYIQGVPSVLELLAVAGMMLLMGCVVLCEDAMY